MSGRRFEPIVNVPRAAVRNFEGRRGTSGRYAVRGRTFFASPFEVAQLWGLDPAGLIVTGRTWDEVRPVYSARVSRALRGRRGDEGDPGRSRAADRAGLLTPRELATAFGVSLVTLYDWRMSGRLRPPDVVNGRIRLWRSDVVAATLRPASPATVKERSRAGIDDTKIIQNTA